MGNWWFEVVLSNDMPVSPVPNSSTFAVFCSMTGTLHQLSYFSVINVIINSSIYYNWRHLSISFSLVGKTKNLIYCQATLNGIFSETTISRLANTVATEILLENFRNFQNNLFKDLITAASSLSINVEVSRHDLKE